MNPLRPLWNVPRWLGINVRNLRGWHSQLPARNRRPTVLQVGAEPGHAYYEALRRGVETSGWNVVWLPRTWEQKVSHRLLLYFLLCRRADAVHLIDVTLMTLFGDHNALRRAMGLGTLRAMLAWPRALGVHTIYSFGDWVPHEMRTAGEEKRHHLICSLVDDVTSPAPSISRSLLDSGVPASRIWPVEHPDIADMFAVPAHWPDARAELGIPRSATVLLQIGNISPYKGLETAIQALRKARDPNLRLLVAGAPVWTCTAEHVHRLAGCDRRILLGPLRRLTNAEMGWLFSAADYCVLPYLAIGHSGVICQALGLGVPVIASRTGSLPDYVKRGAGLLFNPGDADGLARLLDDLPSFDRARARQCSLAIMRPRSPERIGRRLVRLYEYRLGGPEPESEWLF